MIEPKFTKGPWRVHLDKRDGTACAIIEDRTGDCVARTVYRFHRGERNANGNLIAATPEMYEALSEAVERYGKPGGPWNVPSEPGSWIEKAKAALKKAVGEE